MFSPIVYLLRYFSKEKFIEKFKNCSFFNLAVDILYDTSVT